MAVVGVYELLPVVGLVEVVFGVSCVSLSCRMELMKVVGERGVSTCATSHSRTGHTSTSGLDGSSLTMTDWSSLQVKQAENGLLLTDKMKAAHWLSEPSPDIKTNQNQGEFRLNKM